MFMAGDRMIDCAKEIAELTPYERYRCFIESPGWLADRIRIGDQSAAAVLVEFLLPDDRRGSSVLAGGGGRAVLAELAPRPGGFVVRAWWVAAACLPTKAGAGEGN